MQTREFDKAEWLQVKKLSYNIAFSKNQDEEKSYKRKLFKYIHKLIHIYGENATFLATIADFYSYHAPAVKLLKKAYTLAKKNTDVLNLTLISGSISMRLLSMKSVDFKAVQKWLRIFKINLSKYSDASSLDEYDYCCTLFSEMKNNSYHRRN